MTKSSTQSPRFNPSRADAQRVRIDQSLGGRSSPTSSKRGIRGLGALLLLAGVFAGVLGGAYWAHREGYIAIPGLNEVLARAHLGGAASTETLLAPGAQPLAPLRYAWADGFTMSSVVTIETWGEPAGAVSGARGLRAEVDARLGSSTSDGNRFIAFDLLSLTLTEPGADETVLTELQAGLAPAIEGFQGTLLVSERGELVRVQFDFPGAPAEHQPLIDELTHALSATVVTFPSEPVGLGARWRTGSAEHELTLLDASGATIATTLASTDAGTSGTLRRRVAFAGLALTLDGETTALAAAPSGAEASAETPVVWRTTVRPR